MAFKIPLEAKMALLNTFAGIVGGAVSFYADRGFLQLGTMFSIIVGILVFMGAAKLEEKVLRQHDYRWYLNHGAFVYILVWLVVNGLLATY